MSLGLGVGFFWFVCFCLWHILYPGRCKLTLKHTEEHQHRRLVRLRWRRHLLSRGHTEWEISVSMCTLPLPLEDLVTSVWIHLHEKRYGTPGI